MAIKITSLGCVWYTFSTRAEDKATLESDLSADTGGYTDGQGGFPLPLFHPAHLVAHKAINFGGSGAAPPSI